MSEESVTSETVQPIFIKSWTHTIIRPLLIILLVVALMGAIISALSLIYPAANWTVTFLITLVAILESYATAVWLHKPERRSLHHLKYRAAELLVLALLIRLITWAASGNWPQPAAWFTYLSDPLSLFNDGYYWINLILAFVAWQRVSAISGAFLRMQPDDAELAYYQLPRHKREPGNQPLSDDRSDLLQNFAQQFLGGGMIVLLCAALASFDLPQLATEINPLRSGITRLGLSQAMLTSLLLYFLCGFLLLSQGRLAVLQMRWLTSDVTQFRPVGRHWLRRGLLILLLIGLAAAFLPIGSTLPFMHILNLILFIIITLISSLIYLVSFLIFLLLSLLFPLRAAPAEAPPPPVQQPLPPQIPPTAVNDTLQILFSSAFWAVALIVSIAAVLFFLQDRGVKFNFAAFKRIWLTLRVWWQQLWQEASDQWQDLRGGVQSLFQKEKQEADAAQPPWRFVRLNALSPRDKVRYFYLSTVKRADQKGVPRQESETPLEFAADLKTNWPDAQEEIDELTDAFLQARYSAIEIEETDIPPLKKQWQQVKRNLRKRRQDGESDHDL